MLNQIAQSIAQSIATKQLSIYVAVVALVISVVMTHFCATLLAIPVNAALFFGLRWIAHREGEKFS